MQITKALFSAANSPQSTSELIKLLCVQRADVNLGPGDRTPLSAAAGAGAEEVVRALLAGGAEVDGGAPLVVAALAGRGLGDGFVGDKCFPLSFL